jgi:exonuclease SbcD
VHLGVENYGRIDPGTGLSTRLADFLRSIDCVVETALSKNVDLVVFAGDAYKTRDPSPTYQREFARRIRRLSSAGLPTILIAGNHDMPNAVGRAHTMEIFGTLEVENVHVARNPTVFDIETGHGLVQVGVLPWIVRSGLLSRQEYKNKSLQDVTQILLERVETILNGESGLVSRLKPDVPHVLVAHGSVQGAVYGSERTVMLGHDLALPLSLFKNEHWDYVALGHIHRHQALEAEQNPPVVYSGSVERIDFGEEKEDKGFVIAQVERGECAWEFHKLEARRFVTVSVEADGQDPTAQVIDAIERAPVQDAVVRIIIRTTPDRNPLINEKEIGRALASAFHIASITRNVTRLERVRLGNQQAVAGMTPIQVLEQYLQVKQTPPERIELLVRHAETLSAMLQK